MRLLICILLGCSAAAALTITGNRFSEYSSNDAVGRRMCAPVALTEAPCENLTYPEIAKDVDQGVLVLGLSGSGKSTLALFLAGSDKLEAVPEHEGSENFIISDGEDQISTAGDEAVSKTMYPQLIPYKTGNLSFVDCPGFADNRGMCLQIKQALAVNAVFRRTKNIKILLTAGYHSLGLMSSRLMEFAEFLSHTTRLLKKMHKYTDSIGLILTKVPNEFSFVKLAVKDDLDMVTPQVLSMQNLLTQIQRNSSHSFQESERQAVIQLLSKLIVKKGGRYPKVALFRRPTVAGNLRNSKLLVEGFDSMHAMINDLKFASPSPGDFGYTLTPQATLEAGRFLKQTANQLGLATLGLVKQTVREVGSRIITGGGEADGEQLREALRVLKGSRACLQQLQEMKLPGKQEAHHCVQLGFPRRWLEQLKGHVATCSHLMDIANGDLEVDARQAVAPLADADWYLGELEVLLGVADKVTQVTQSSFSRLLDRLATELQNPILGAAVFEDKAMVQRLLQRVRAEGLDGELSELRDLVLARANETAADFIQYADGMDPAAARASNIIEDLEDARDCVKRAGTALARMQPPPRCGRGSGTQSFHSLRRQVGRVAALVATGLLSSEAVDAAARGLQGSQLSAAEAHIAELHAWYSALRQLRGRLGSAAVLQEGELSQARIEELLMQGVPDHVTVTARQALRQRMKDYWKDPTAKHKGLPALRALLQQLHSNQLVTKTGDESNAVTVSGYVVRMSRVLPLIEGEIQEVKIVAAHSIVLDQDLDLKEDRFSVSQMTLVAPLVVVAGDNRKMKLDGKDGRAWDGDAKDEQDGSPGLSGSAGGTLLLLAGRVHNAAGLTVTTNGGRGGPGQKGGKGANGKDGKDATEPPRKWTGHLDTGKYCIPGSITESVQRLFCLVNTFVDGEPGRNGGSGGAGGNGGRGGWVRTYVAEGARIETEAKSGATGDPGAGGPGGNGGVNGRSRRLHYRTRSIGGGSSQSHNTWYEWHWRGYAANGEDGKAGENTLGRQSPLEPKQLAAEAPYEAVALYRRTLREVLDTTILDDVIVEGFLDDLADGKVVKRRDVNGVAWEAYELAQDVSLLEEDFSRLGRPAAYAPLYEAAMRRLQGLASDKDLPDTVEPLMGAAFSVVSTSLDSFRVTRVPDLVADISGFLDKARGSATLWQQRALRVQDTKTEERAEAASQAAKEAHRAMTQALQNGIREKQDFLSTTLTRAIINIEKDAMDVNTTLSSKLNEDKETEEKLTLKLGGLKAMQAFMKIAGKLFKGFNDLVDATVKLSEPLKVNKMVGNIIMDEVNDKVAKETAKLEAELKNLQHDIKILDTLLPLLRKFEAAVTAARNVTSAIGVRQLKLSDKILPLRKALARWDMLPEVEQSMTQYLNLLDDTLTHQQEVLEQLEQAANHQLLANLIVSTVPGTKAREDKFSLAVATLEAELAALSAGGALLAEYHTAIAGFRQWAFPFSSDLIDTIPVPGLMKKTSALKKMAEAAVEDVTYLKNKVGTQATTMTSIKKFVRTTAPLAKSSPLETSSLLVWRGQKHHVAIRALLRGEEAPLLGAVEAALQADGLDAVKVAEVQLLLSSTDPQVKQRLDVAMKDASVNMTHSGVHHYRCGRSLYRIVTPAQEILYSVQKDTAGSPYNANDVYRTLETVQPVMSPFTTWVAQISGGGTALRDLESDAALVDAHLVARVSYVRGYPCPASLGRSYQEDQCPAGQPAASLPALGVRLLQPMFADPEPY